MFGPRYFGDPYFGRYFGPERAAFALFEIDGRKRDQSARQVLEQQLAEERAREAAIEKAWKIAHGEWVEPTQLADLVSDLPVMSEPIDISGLVTAAQINAARRAELEDDESAVEMLVLSL